MRVGFTFKLFFLLLPNLAFSAECSHALKAVSKSSEVFLNRLLKASESPSKAEWVPLVKAIASSEEGKLNSLEFQDGKLSTQIQVNAKRNQLNITIGETKLKDLAVGENPPEPTAALRPLIKSLALGILGRVKNSGKEWNVSIKATDVQNAALAKSLKLRGFQSRPSLMRKLFAAGTIFLATSALYHEAPLYAYLATSLSGWFTYRHTGQTYSLNFQVKPK